MATDGRVAWAARLLGAMSLLAVGSVHLEQYEARYSAIPTIGTLFLVSFIGALVIATALVLPFEILLGRRGGAVIVLVTLAAIGQAVSQFVFLAISERRPLFGFQEPGYDPTAIRAAQAAEIATVSFLGAFLVARSLRRRAEARRPPFPTVPREHHGLTFR